MKDFLRLNHLCVIGTVAHHRKLEEIYNLGTIQAQEDYFKTRDSIIISI